MPGISEWTWLATGCAVVAFLLLPILDRAPIRAVLIVAVSVACALWHLRFRPVVRSPVEHVAWSFALLSCGWALACVAVNSRRRLGTVRTSVDPPILKLARLAAILYGVVSCVILAVLLAMRSAVVAAELLNGGPGGERFTAAFSADGLWSVLCLLAASSVSLVSTRDGRLGACVCVLGSMGIAWACLLSANYVTNELGAYERTAALLWLVVGESLWLLAATLLHGRLTSVARPTRVPTHLNEAHHPAIASAAVRPGTRGLRLCCDGLALVLLLLISYHVVVPHRASGLGYFSSAGLSAASALLAAGSCALWLRRSWREITVGVGLGHLSIAICSTATLLSLRSDLPLREMYPAVFSAMMLGCCLAAGLCTLFALRGRAIREAASSGESGRDCDAQGLSAIDALLVRLTPTARRFAFLNTALAFLVGVLMMVWPRMPAVATMDDSLARVTAGLSAILFLLLVVLWCGRRLRQPVFHVMSVFTVLLAGGFLLVRILPFSSRVG